MAASAVALSALILLFSSLRARGRVAMKSEHSGGGALERGHGTPLEALAQLGDSLGCVGASALGVEAAELVAGQTAKGKEV
eukprot:scaffold29846_cov45-Phaeocystis_antarctica.AAC.2